MTTETWFLDQARLGNMYHAANATARALSTLSTTCVGLALSNPYGSDKLLVVYNVTFVPSAAPAGASPVGIAISTAPSETATTHTTPMVIHNAICAGATTKCMGRADEAATLASTPLWLRPMGAILAASSITPAKYEDLTRGTIIIPPGAVLSLSMLTTATTGLASVTWVEIDR